MSTDGAVTFRDVVLYYGRRRGWSTQRHIAVACEIDESALSRFLKGEQDIGTCRAHALFQQLGIPAAHYDVVYSLLAQAQRRARATQGLAAA